MEIIKLKKSNIVIYYDCILKYPVCVIEQFKNGFVDIGIKRKDYNDPFIEDDVIPKQYSLMLQDYENYIEYGGSYGHNAPAGFHKESIESFKETFLLTNICPQEGVFNAGRWLLLEEWTKNIINKYKHVYVLTGSIKGDMKTFNNSTINIPSYMYKIIIVYTNDKYYIIAYKMPNERATDSVPISNFMIDVSKMLTIIFKEMNFDISKIITKITQHNKVYDLAKITNPNIIITPNLKQNMLSSKLYGKLIYAESLAELEKVYADGLQKKLIGKYHERAYEIAKKKLNK